jgi:hypothetical protein
MTILRTTLATLALLALFTMASSAAVPAAPRNPRATVTGSTITLTWDDGDGPAPASYIVEAFLSPTAPLMAALAAPGRVVTVPNVPAGTYYVRIRARNTDGQSGPSEFVTFSVGGGSPACNTPPNAPRNVTGSASGSRVSVGWHPSEGSCVPASYVVHAGSSPGASNIAVADVGASLGLSAVAPSGVYYIRVFARNSAGLSPPSNEVSVMVNQEVPTGTLTGAWRQGYTTVFCVINPGDCRILGNRAAFAMTLQLQQHGTTITGSYFAKYDDVRAISLRKEADGRVHGSHVTLTLTPSLTSNNGRYGGTFTGTVHPDFRRLTGVFVPAFTTADPGLPRDAVAITGLIR